MASYFTSDLFRFLSELETHNNRDWFQANKERYEKSVRDPFLQFVTDLQPRLKKISPRFVADPRPVGGSMMRIYRDTRFSKDKTPYKTSVMATFWHDKSKEEAAPSFYMRLHPGDSATGGGIWHPEPVALKKIRKAIVDRTTQWKSIRTGKVFGTSCGMAGESLKRPPTGFAADHPFIEDIKRKDFAVTMPLDDKTVVSASFMDDVVDSFRATTPFLEFLTRAIGLSF